jgi:hypothetical protein
MHRQRRRGEGYVAELKLKLGWTQATSALQRAAFHFEVRIPVYVRRLRGVIPAAVGCETSTVGVLVRFYLIARNVQKLA